MEDGHGSLDQIFRARKRRLTSAAKPSSKSKKPAKFAVPEEVLEVLSTKKENLDAFLFAGKVGSPPACSDEVSRGVSGPTVPELRGELVNLSKGKPWLTPCLTPSLHASLKSGLHHINPEDIGKIGKQEIGRDSAHSPRETKVILSPGSLLTTQAVVTNPLGFDGFSRRSKSTGSGVQDAAVKKDISSEIKYAVERTSPLSQFANDFLSLCYSGINASESTFPQHADISEKRKPDEGDVCCEGEELSASLDRVTSHHSLSGCPQTAVGSIGKDVADHESFTNFRPPGFGDDVATREVANPPVTSSNDIKSTVKCTRAKTVGGKDSTSGSLNVCASLGKDGCTSSPKCHLELTPEACYEQRSMNVTTLERNGGVSNYRSSVFSPGDEFWKEAIDIVMASNVDILKERCEANTNSKSPSNRDQKSSNDFNRVAVEERNQSGLENCCQNDNRRSDENGVKKQNKYPAFIEREKKALQRPESAEEGLQHRGSPSDGSVAINLNLSTETTQKGSVDFDCLTLDFTSEARLLQAPKAQLVETVNEQEPGDSARSSSGPSNCLQKTNENYAAGGWQRQFGTQIDSPLPVRRFDFSLKEFNCGHDVHQDPRKRDYPANVLANQSTIEEEIVRNPTRGVLYRADADHVECRHGGSLPMPSSSVADGGAVADPAYPLADTNLRNSGQASRNSGIVVKEQPIDSIEVNRRGAVSDNLSNGTLHQRSLNLSDWLPQEVAAVYATKGLKELYPWQLECLQLRGVLHGRNLVYSASTSAGKSLVAELLMIKRIIATHRMALLVLPFVSICSEKAEHLEAILEPLGKRVRNFFGAQGSSTIPKDTSIAVCTIEKANSLINKLLEESRLSEVAVMVIDELHMVGDRERGYLLELLLTKVRFACGEFDKIQGLSQEVTLVKGLSPASEEIGRIADLQLIGMSATMPNIDALAHWLQAALYRTDFRPVPLVEYMKVGNTIYNNRMEIIRMLRKEADIGGRDPDHVIELCHEVVKEGHSVLVFCASRKACETTALHIAKYLPSIVSVHGKSNMRLMDGTSAVEELRKSSSGLDRVLAQTLPAGVAYHHAGLMVEEREIVERCFKQGVVQVLTATSTLAAGVNLPARRVIFRQPKIGREFLDGTRYRQMAGRAGRAGIDTKGESVLICKPEEVRRMVTVLSEDCQPLQSCLRGDKIGMMRALLEVVAGGIVQSPDDVNRYVRCTLFNSTHSFDKVVKSVQDSLRWLCQKKFLEWNAEAKEYSTTPLGRAAFGSSLSPDESLVVFEDLAKARESFILASDLHLVYQVTPVYVDLEPDWCLFYQKFVELSQLEQAVGIRVGVSEAFLMRMAHGAPLEAGSRSKGIRSPQNLKTTSPIIHGIAEGNHNNRHQTIYALRVSRRFYVALMLSKLVQEVPVLEVADGFKVSRGTVQALQASAGRFAAMVSGFCEKLGWHDIEGLVSKFQSRVSFGVRSEIVELTEIPFVKGARARAFYKSGFRTVQAVAEATLPELLKAIQEASPWVIQDDPRIRMQQRALMTVVQKIKGGAQRIVLDRAEEARTAAFSAMRALGVDVPSSLWPLLQTSIRGIPAKVEGAPMSSFEATNDTPTGDPSHLVGNKCPKSQPQNLGSKATLNGMSTTHADNPTPLVTACLQNGHEATELKQRNKVHAVRISKAEEVSNRGGVCYKGITEQYRGTDGSTSNPDYSFDVDVLDQKASNKESSNDLDGVEGRNCGPVDVDRIVGGFDCFFDNWSASAEFFFDLNYKSQTAETPLQVFDIEGVAICWQNSPIYYVRLAPTSPRSFESRRNDSLSLNGQADNSSNHQIVACFDDNMLDQFRATQVRWKKISSILSRRGPRKVSWNLKHQVQALRHAGVSLSTGNPYCAQTGATSASKNLHVLSSIVLGEPYLDTQISAWLLWPDEESSRCHSLEQEAKKRLPIEVAANASKAGRWTNQIGRVFFNGCCRRAAQIRALHSTLWKLLIAENLQNPMLTIEMPMVKVLAEMETAGLGVDMDACGRIRKGLEQKIASLEARAHELAGITFSLAVPADVANALYKHMKLAVPPGCKKGKLHPSTNKRALDFLRQQHPVARVIQEHRKLSKLLHGTIASIYFWAKAPQVGASETIERLLNVHQIFGRWLQTSTATGRLAMEEPNLQCVENTICYRSEDLFEQDVREHKEEEEVNVRKVFVPTQENWIILSADYSQIELRLMAHFSEDAALIALLSRPSGDLFRLIASQWTGRSEATVTACQREQTKQLVYGILYGMGVHALAEQLNCTVAEASLYLERFRSTFPQVNQWLQQASINCRQSGYVMTLGGRKRHFDKISNGRLADQAKAERQAVNSICQGSAADLIKMAMIRLHAAMVGDECEANRPPIEGHCRLLLQMHDELVMEVDKDFLKEVSLKLRSCMEGAASLKGKIAVAFSAAALTNSKAQGEYVLETKGVAGWDPKLRMDWIGCSNRI